MINVQERIRELKDAGAGEPFAVTNITLNTTWSGEEPNTEATVKVEVGSRQAHSAGDGVGPIDAFDCALHKAIAEMLPKIDSITLYDYHIELIKRDGNRSPGGIVRCIVKFRRGSEHWVSVAEHQNQDHAGWMAILDAYKLAVMT